MASLAHSCRAHQARRPALTVGRLPLWSRPMTRPRVRAFPLMHARRCESVFCLDRLLGTGGIGGKGGHRLGNLQRRASDPAACTFACPAAVQAGITMVCVVGVQIVRCLMRGLEARPSRCTLAFVAAVAARRLGVNASDVSDAFGGDRRVLADDVDRSQSLDDQPSRFSQ